MRSTSMLCVATAVGMALSPLAPAQTPGSESAQAKAGAVVSIDPASGRQRPVEHDDGRDAALPAASRSPVHGHGPAREIYSRVGARGMLLDESFLSYTVVRRRVDGSLDATCVVGESTAARLLESAPIARKAKAGGAHETE